MFIVNVSAGLYNRLSLYHFLSFYNSYTYPGILPTMYSVHLYREYAIHLWVKKNTVQHILCFLGTTQRCYDFVTFFLSLYLYTIPTVYTEKVLAVKNSEVTRAVPYRWAEGRRPALAFRSPELASCSPSLLPFTSPKAPTQQLRSDSPTGQTSHTSQLGSSFLAQRLYSDWTVWSSFQSSNSSPAY